MVAEPQPGNVVATGISPLEPPPIGQISEYAPEVHHPPGEIPVYAPEVHHP